MTSVTRLEGVGPAIEQRLDDKGIRCLETLAHSTLTEVCEVQGVEPGMVLAAQEFLQSEREWTRKRLVRNADRKYWCEYCDDSGDSYRASGANGATALKLHTRRCSENPSAPRRFR